MSRSFCQKCRWQVTVKYACTLRMWHCMKRHGAWLYGVHRTRRDGSSFMWHQPCQRCKYTTLVDIKKHAIKAIHSCSITCERGESALERRIALYKSGQPTNQPFTLTGIKNSETSSTLLLVAPPLCFSVCLVLPGTFWCLA